MRKLAPLALIGLGLWLLVGCFRVAGPEHVYTRFTPSTLDFRNMVGDPDSGRKIHVGVTRAQIAATLGKPDWLGPGSNGITYRVWTQRGYWIAPLCFSVQPALRVYELRLDFDEHDILTAWSTSYEEFGNDVTAPTDKHGPHEIAHSTAPIPSATRPASLPTILP